MGNDDRGALESPPRDVSLFVGRWAEGGARLDVACETTQLIYRFIADFERLAEMFDERVLYRDPRDGRLWEFTDLEPFDRSSESRLAVLTEEEAAREFGWFRAAEKGSEG